MVLATAGLDGDVREEEREGGRIAIAVAVALGTVGTGSPWEGQVGEGRVWRVVTVVVDDADIAVSGHMKISRPVLVDSGAAGQRDSELCARAVVEEHSRYLSRAGAAGPTRLLRWYRRDRHRQRSSRRPPFELEAANQTRHIVGVAALEAVDTLVGAGD